MLESHKEGKVEDALAPSRTASAGGASAWEVRDQGSRFR